MRAAPDQRNNPFTLPQDSCSTLTVGSTGYIGTTTYSYDAPCGDVPWSSHSVNTFSATTASEMFFWSVMSDHRPVCIWFDMLTVAGSGKMYPIWP